MKYIWIQLSKRHPELCEVLTSENQYQWIVVFSGSTQDAEILKNAYISIGYELRTSY